MEVFVIGWNSEVSVNIQGIENMNYDEIIHEIKKGGRFVNFYFCFSFIIFTSKQPSDIYFLRHNENAFLKGLGPTLITLIFGWWSPMGIIRTIECLIYNLGKSKNITDDIMDNLKFKLLLPSLFNYTNNTLDEELNNNSNDLNLYPETKYCKYCGEEIPNIAIYCKKCGKKVID